VVPVAGCSELIGRSPSGTSTPGYDRLGQTPTYVSDDVGLRLPDDVPRVKAPSNADLVVLHGNLAVDVEQAVTWLADERVIALLGTPSERGSHGHSARSTVTRSITRARANPITLPTVGRGSNRN
jgi:hypothetical protein